MATTDVEQTFFNPRSETLHGVWSMRLPPGAIVAGFEVRPEEQPSLLETLGLIIMIVEDPAARDRTLARRDPVCISNQRFGNKCHSKPSPKIESIESRAKLAAPRENKPPPPATRAHLRVIQNRRGSGSKYGRGAA